MSQRTVVRRYRVRVAIRGANEVEGYVEFILDAGVESPEHPLFAVPVVAGSFVHPLDGATELRPVQVECLDVDGALIDAFAEQGRWAALGRIVDIQYQDVLPSEGPWITYGTGRCSGLDEMDGPGKFRVEISDETWVVREAVDVFGPADTTCLWPKGLVYHWRGFLRTGGLNGTRSGASSPYRITVNSGTSPITAVGPTRELVDYIEKDAVPQQLQTTTGVNFKHLRLRYAGVDYEINGFGNAAGYSIETIEAELDHEGELGYLPSFSVWVVASSTPPASSVGGVFLYAPTAPVTTEMPLHLGVIGDHRWGVPATSGDDGGYLHPADLTRRVWQVVGARYNEESLYQIEQDVSFPLLAPLLDGLPTDPQKWLQEQVWGPNMLLALRDVFGRLKLVDVRPPDEDTDFSTFPILTASNSDKHRWRLVGRDALNAVLWEVITLARDDPQADPPFTGVIPGAAGGFDDKYVTAGDGQSSALDGMLRRIDTVGPFDGDTLAYIGRRQRTFSAKAALEPLNPAWFRISIWAPPVRASFWQDIAAALSRSILTIYQDGPQIGTCTVDGELAETLAEGDYVVVNAGSVKIANAGTAARWGYVLVLLLSITRYPAHAECEYLVIRPVDIFLCPTVDDPLTWWASQPGEGPVGRLYLGTLTEPAGQFGVEVTAQKDQADGQTVNMEIAFYQGAVELEHFYELDISETATTYTYMMDPSIQAGITDWSDLYVEIYRTGDTGEDSIPANTRRLYILAVNPIVL